MKLTLLDNIPFNIDLLRVTKKDIERLQLKEVKEISIFNNTNNFHQEGLFSTEIFGHVGTEYRKRTFGYIDLKAELLHPFIYYATIKLKSFYKDIMAGKVLAEWDSETKSFIKSHSHKANTGYSFFIKHFDELQFERTGSEKRDFLISLIEKAKKENTHKIRYLLVLPAGLRDYTIDSSGKPQEDEINTYYRKIIAQANLIDEKQLSLIPEVYDNVFFSIQSSLLDLFEYIKSLLDGKNKLILGKWLTRKIFNSTRNVFSSAIEKSTHITDGNRLKYNEVYVGLHQFLRVLVPKSIYEIKNRYISSIFIENSNFCYLTNAKTLKKEEVLNSHIQKEYEEWTSFDGLESVIASFANLDIRHLPITLNKGKHYLGLIYQDNKYFKFFQDIDELPDNLDRSKVSPITLAEFLYISIHHLSGKIPGLITRYPITGYGSIYPAFMKLKTTNKFKVLEELDENWQPSGVIAYNFPIRDEVFFNTISVHPSHLAALGADFDGDTASLTAVLTEEAIEEIKNLFKKKEYYIAPDGRFFFSNDVDVLSTVLNFMTG